MRLTKRLLSLSFILALCLSALSIAAQAALPEGAGAVVLKGCKRDMAWPVPSSAALSSCFLDPLAERDHVHYAIDIAAAREATIVPVYDGTVYLVMDNNSPGNNGYGNSVIVKHTYPLATGESVILYSRYSHMNSVDVKQGQRVRRGVTRLGGIGGSGATENTYPDHLDFQIIYTRTGTLTLSEMTNRKVTSIDPIVNQLLEIPSRLNSSGASEFCTCCADYVAYVKGLYARPMTYGYLSKCQGWASYASLKVTSETALRSQPCHGALLETSEVLETAMPDAVYTATALYRNTVGEYWYRVNVSQDLEGYLPAEAVLLEELLYDDVTVTEANWPTVQQQNHSFDMKGAVTNQYTKMVHVRASIHDDGIEVMASSAEPIARTFALSGSAVDNRLAFSDLALGGHTYRLSVLLRNHYLDKDGQTVLQQEQSVILLEKRFSVVSTLTCQHSFTAKTVEPTCTEPGYEAQICQCGYTQYSDLEPLGHDCPSWTAQPPATCLTDGLAAGDCVRCGQPQEKVLPALGHILECQRTEESCTGVPMTRTSCTRCHDTWVAYDEDCYSAWQTALPDVEESLLRSRTEYRGKTRSVTTDTVDTKADWTLYDTVTDWGEYGPWSEWTEEKQTADDAVEVQTRQLYGYYYYSCESCGKQMHTNYCYSWAEGCGKAITGEKQVLWLELSWDDAGLKRFHSTGAYCTQQEGKTLFKLGSQPKTQYRCRTRAMETTYHFERWSDWSDWTASVLEPGQDLQVETRTTYSYVMTGSGQHRYKKSIALPTCTRQGHTTYTCAVCGDSYRADLTDVISHRYGEWKTLVRATCNRAGSEQRFCQDCTDRQERSVEQLSHSFEKGKCTLCGGAEYAPGDVNRDRQVNILDVMELINSITGTLPLDADQRKLVDLSGDGMANILDIMAVIGYITGE